ncbi:cytochrome p450 [Diplodia corticola]|uniref:Cytochrome p450 n=1 Tax=Diplodia corticola TaxID=236234 RepID=A0A1J9S5C0_9PEZI|nr:cytochrome p450 [Diplodia corticola]OJD35711.1 cytochrome p450 [Diplodia corticola]
MIPVVSIAVWAVVFLLAWRVSRIGRRPPGYPPGPPTLPIVGNLHQIPSENQHEQFQKWAKQYGPIYSLIMGTKTLIVLNNDQVVKDLLDKRSAIYSDRMEMYTTGEIASGGLRMLAMMRKMNHALLNVNVAKSYVPYQDLENKQMLVELLDDPDSLLQHVRRYSSSLVASIVFGWRTPSYDNAKLNEFYSAFGEFVALAQTAGAALPDFYPLLRKLPGIFQPRVQQARRLHVAEKALYLSNWLAAKRAVASGTANPCFCVDMARRQARPATEDGGGGFSDDLAAYMAGTLFEAGSDTTSSTLYGFVQGALLYPACQRRAQRELDAVVGDGRLPTLDDVPRLPYVVACVKEAMRWMPTAALGAAPHAVTQDDEYLGYRIPKGAGVMMNIWAIHRDERRYERPEEFWPDRFDGDTVGIADSATLSDVKKRDQFGFGAGRRICQGMHVAERSLLLGIARLMWGFDITPVIDKATGKPKLPEQDKLVGGLVMLPDKYEACIRPRSERHAEVMRAAWAESKQQLDEKTGQWTKIPESMALPRL